METIVIDGEKMLNRRAAHDHLAEQLSLPDYYGRNLDALFDCLTDRSEDVTVRLLHWGNTAPPCARHWRTPTGPTLDWKSCFRRTDYTKTGYSKYTIVG